jgi:hypothetical protein
MAELALVGILLWIGTWALRPAGSYWPLVLAFATAIAGLWRLTAILVVGWAAVGP